MSKKAFLQSGRHKNSNASAIFNYRILISVSVLVLLLFSGGASALYSGGATESDSTLDLNKTVSQASSLMAQSPVAPKLTIYTSSPSVILKGNNITISGTAEDTDKLIGYAFAPNFSYVMRIVVENGKYAMSIPTANITIGSPIFVIIQHPMYDHLFNIIPISDQQKGTCIYQNNNAQPTGGPGDIFLFSPRQTNGVYAYDLLRQALDDPKNDDIYKDLKFSVGSPQVGPAVVPKLTIETSSPSVISKGDNITISGVAEGANKLFCYVLAPEYFHPYLLDIENGTYAINISTAEISLGSPCFVIIQHPMYDRFFNVLPIYDQQKGNSIYLNYKTEVTGTSSDIFQFNMRKTNGIDAYDLLTQALNDPQIDDIYVDLKFSIDSEEDTPPQTPFPIIGILLGCGAALYVYRRN